MLGIEVPPIGHLVDWPEFIFEDSELFGINKVVLLMFLAALLTFLFFFLAGRGASLVPKGLQNLAESAVEFVRDQIVMQTIGPEGVWWVPFLTTLFVFIFIGNLFEVIPIIQMPINARMALPALMALLVWLIYNFVGFRHQGFGYLRSVMFPPGVPKALYIIVTPIEFVSRFVVQPFALAVRLFANMVAGHLLLVSFAVISAALFEATIVGGALPWALLVALTGFEVLVAGLQAYIFTILTAVYISGSLQAEH